MNSPFIIIMRRTAIVAAVFIFSMCSAMACYGAPTAKEIENRLKDEEKRLDKIQKQINYHKVREKEITVQERGVAKQLESINGKLVLTEQQMTVIELKRVKLQRNLLLLGDDIKGTSTRIEQVKGLLRERLVSIYKYGGVAEFNLLFSAAGADDAMANTYLLGKIAEQDQSLIQELVDKKARLDNAHKDTQRNKEMLDDQNKQLSRQQRDLKVDTEKRNVLLDKVRKEKTAHTEAQKELERAEKELEKTIERLLDQKRKAAQAARVAAAKANKKPPEPEKVYYTGGRLQWPHRGKIMSNFGTRTHPIFKTRIQHTGLDIDGNKGDPVYAAEAGEVLYANWLRGYGQVIIIDHGKNMTTVYAHLSKILTQEGAVVKQGGLIGRVGSTGLATGHHLHFEVRINGKSVNPMPYLNK